MQTTSPYLILKRCLETRSKQEQDRRLDLCGAKVSCHGSPAAGVGVRIAQPRWAQEERFAGRLAGTSHKLHGDGVAARGQRGVQRKR